MSGICNSGLSQTSTILFANHMPFVFFACCEYAKREKLQNQLSRLDSECHTMSYNHVGRQKLQQQHLKVVRDCISSPPPPPSPSLPPTSTCHTTVIDVAARRRPAPFLSDIYLKISHSPKNISYIRKFPRCLLARSA